MDFCHNVNPVRQPDQRVNPGGDCFACATLAVMQHLFPDDGLDLAYIHKVFTVQYSTGGDTFCNSWGGWDKVFHRLKYGCSDAGLTKRFNIEARKFLPFNLFTDYFNTHSHAWYPGPHSGEYWWMVDAILRAGYLILVEINLDGAGPVGYTPAGEIVKNGIDHVVAIDGSRQVWRPNKHMPESSTLCWEVHIVDSNQRTATNEYWLDVDDLLLRHGAGGFWMVREFTGYYPEVRHEPADNSG